jgi:hypothetical protein
MLDQRRLDVDREETALLPHRAREIRHEVTRPGAQVRHHVALAQPQEPNDIAGLLPGITLRVVKDPDPVIDVVKAMSNRGVVTVLVAVAVVLCG